MKKDILTIYGSHEKYDLEIVKLKLDTKNLDEKKALETGWLIHDGKWYHSRSTRIDLSLASKKLPKIPGVTFSLGEYDKKLDVIFEQYMSIKKFSKHYDFKVDLNRAEWIVVEDTGTPVAFTKMTNYDGGIESTFSAWNYHKPKLSIGAKLLHYEIDHARSKSLDHLYIGAGYGPSAIYKSKYDGFEWWTGNEWSTDKNEFVRLCDRDETINTLEDLARILNE